VLHHAPVRSSVATPAPRPQPPGGAEPPGEDGSPWQAFTDTATPSAEAEDTLRGSRRIRRHDHINAGSRWDDPRFRRNALIVGIVGGALLMAGLAIGVYYLFFRDTTTPPGKTSGGSVEKPTARTGPIYVSKSKVDPNDLDSLEEAIRRAGPRDRIVVRDQEIYEERIEVALGGKRSLVIEAERDAAGNTATLRAPANLPAGEALVTIDRVEGFRLKGFTLDGARRCDEIINLSGVAAGTVLEELRIKGFNKAGIHLASAQGARGKELILRDLWVEADRDKGQTAHAALYLSLPPRLASGANSNILVQNCRFIGPYVQAVPITTPLHQVTFERNVFYGGGKQCFSYGSTGPSDLLLDFRLSNNTFAGYESVIELQQATNFSSNILLNGNLFYQIRQGILVIRNEVVEKLPEVLKGEHNLHDSAVSKSGLSDPNPLPNLKLGAVDFQLPTKSTSANDFLRYSSKSPLATAGKDKGAVGALEPLP
jgi:hypothetical protein